MNETSSSVSKNIHSPDEVTWRQHVARWISIVGHPFVFILAFVLAGSLRHMPWPRALAITGVFLVVGIAPMTLFLSRQVRLGRSNFDVSARERRGPVYALGLALGAALMVAAQQLGAPDIVLAVMACGLAMVILAAAINLRLKVSLHSAFATWISLSWWRLDPNTAVALMVLALAVAWSRLQLRRHSWPEVAVGMLLGAALAFLMLGWDAAFG